MLAASVFEPAQKASYLPDPVCGLRRALVRLSVPAQPVDATPSKQLIRQYFPWRTDLFGCTRSNPSQGSVPADLTHRAILAFVFNARWVEIRVIHGRPKPDPHQDQLNNPQTPPTP